MKQSTKLLSLVLALIMAFSCMSVIGNAVTTFTGPTQVAYDNIDDANLTAEQVILFICQNFFSKFIHIFLLKCCANICIIIL